MVLCQEQDRLGCSTLGGIFFNIWFMCCTLIVHCGTTQFNSSWLFLIRTEVNVIYCIASVVPIWNCFLLVVLAITGGLGVLCDGQWTSKKEIALPGSDLERRWHERAKCMYNFVKI